MPDTADHASVVLHVSHPEGISEHHEQALAEAVGEAVKKVEAHGFHVHKDHGHIHHGHVHIHRHHHDHKPAA